MARSTYTTRAAAQRQIDHAIGNLDKAMAHLLHVKNVYAGAHPDIATACEELMQALMALQNIMQKFRYSF